jgi:hypothetical protein
MGVVSTFESRLLARSGVLLLVVSLLNGFLVHASPLPRLSLSAHLVGLMGALFLLALAALWPTLTGTTRASRVGAWLAVYSFAGGWVVYFIAAATGAGGMFPMAAGGARGAPVVEVFVSVGMITVALALVALCIMVLRGTRAGRPA